MCDPVSMGIAMGVGALASVGGTAMSLQAQRSSANAISAQNAATEQAQNEAFNERMRATAAQTAAQTQVMNQTMADRNAAFTQMRAGQTAAMAQQQDILSTENTQADALRQAGDTAANTMLASTSAPNLVDAQAGSQAQAAALLASPTTAPILGPTATSPTGDPGTDATTQAIARRTAQAATNIRDYGAKVGAVTSYAAPGQAVSDAIAANKFGIMPAQTAAGLLQSGSAVRLLPAQIAYQNATATGSATDALIASRGQSGLDTAGLSYGNAVDIANLGQQNADTLAANTAAQAKADAAAQASLGGLVTGVGNLGLYGVGYLGGGPDWLKNLLPGSQVPGAANLASIAPAAAMGGGSAAGTAFGTVT